MFTGSVQIDFEVFKAITARRASAEVSENDVLRELLGIPVARSTPNPSGETYWQSDGARFPMGAELRHCFRGGRIVTASITQGGVEVEGKVYAGLSPAAVAVTGHHVNGWHFWEVRSPTGNWLKADALRHARG